MTNIKSKKTWLMFDCRNLKSEMAKIALDKDLEFSEIETKVEALANLIPGLTDASQFAKHVAKICKAGSPERAIKLINVLEDFVPKTWAVRSVIVGIFVMKWSLILAAIGLVVYFVSNL